MIEATLEFLGELEPMMRLEPLALGQRPPLDEGAEVGPPPAAVDRAQTVFEMTGIILLLLIAFGCVWFLLRRRR